ncbi:MAG: ATP-binding cassette domain-containing protein [Verrucomicrobiota bacterium]
MITLDSISWTAPGATFALRDVSLSIPANTYAVLMGSTGCGKTTLLELICGLRKPRSGRILLDSQDVTALEPRQRGIGYVPQDLALFPAKRVREQILFPLKMRGMKDGAKIVQELVEELGIAHLLDRLPDNLSGGEKQRVALARALAAQPRVLLLDEPLSALDETTHGTAMELLRTLQARHSLTVLHVTHSPSEAAALGQMRLRLMDGCVGTHS